MTLITGFLMAYALFTGPLLAWGLLRAWKKSRPEPEKTPKTELENLLKAALGKHGIVADVHEMPQSPEEMAMAQSRLLLTAIQEGNHAAVAWFTALRASLDVNKRDMDAVMIAMQAMTKALLEPKKEAAEPKGDGSIETFVHSLEYARDQFADTPVLKRAVQTIIRNVKKEHGTK